MSVKTSYEDLAKKVRDLERQSKELQRSRAALQRSEMLFRDLVEKLPFPIAVGTKDLQTLYMNPKFTEVFGYTADDIPDQKAWRQKLMPDSEYRNQKSHEVDLWMRSDDRSAIFQRCFTDTSGRLHDVVVHTIRLDDRYYNVLEDVTERVRAEEEQRRAHEILEQRVEQRTADLTRANQQLQAEIHERRRAEKALRDSEEKYRLLVDNANDTIFVTQDGMIKFANPSAIEMTGYSATELSDLPFADIIHPDDREKLLDRHFQQLRGENIAANYTFRLLSKAGAELWQQINSVAITWEDRPATLSFIRDITTEKRLEGQLIQSQKMKAIGTLAGGIAHDFNNLMTTIQGNVSLMLFDVPSSHPNHQNLINIEKQIQRGTRLTSQLLGFAKRGKSQICSVNLNELVAKTAETFGRTNKLVSIHQELATDLLPVEVDRDRIEQALLNLYLNAAEAMPRGGRLLLKTKNVSHKTVSGQLNEPPPGRYSLCSISDSGEGVTKEIQEQMFDPFFTTKESGTGSGLGLATVYSVINSHNGYIEVESDRGKGTTFYIYLPAIETGMASVEAESDQIVEGCGTILLVDDEEMVMEVGGQLLEKLGYHVLRAVGGKQAVAIYEKNQDLIDLVILDIIMPEMDGAAVFDRLRQINSDVTVLLASGYSIDGKVSGILKRGASGFISKPFTLQQLSQKINALVPPAGKKAKN